MTKQCIPFVVVRSQMDKRNLLHVTLDDVYIYNWHTSLEKENDNWEKEIHAYKRRKDLQAEKSCSYGGWIGFLSSVELLRLQQNFGREKTVRSHVTRA